MSGEVIRVPNHLADRRHARQQHTGRHAPISPSLPLELHPKLDGSVDCYLDCNHADPAAGIDVTTASAAPSIVSRVMAGYGEQCREFTDQALADQGWITTQPE